jgi:hypothetical protein
MDQELASLLRAAAGGLIRDPERVRGILKEARQQMVALGRLTYRAERAFVSGWDGRDPRKPRRAD